MITLFVGKETKWIILFYHHEYSFKPLSQGKKEYNIVDKVTSKIIFQYFVGARFNMFFKKWVMSFPWENNLKTDLKSRPPWLGDKEKFLLYIT